MICGGSLMTPNRDAEAERSMKEADEANGEGDAGEESPEPVNDTEERYGHDESPA
jgi:hypothetical protein